MDENADVLKFVKEYNPGFPIGAITHPTAAAYMHIDPSTRAFVPFMLFIDRKGVIQSQYTGSDEFLKEEEKMDANIRGELAKRMGLKADPPKAGAGKKKK